MVSGWEGTRQPRPRPSVTEGDNLNTPNDTPEGMSRGRFRIVVSLCLNCGVLPGTPA